MLSRISATEIKCAVSTDGGRRHRVQAHEGKERIESQRGASYEWMYRRKTLRLTARDR